MRAGLLSAFLAFAVPFTAAATEPKIVTEEFMVPAKDPGIQLYVRNKHPEGISQYGPERTLLFVHGSTYPAEAAFDLPLDGMSWMDFIARHGFDVYLVDVRGYGRSTRPKEMDQPPEANEPIVTTEVARRDVGAAVDFILNRRGIAKLDLLGWSWGTAIMGSYAAENPDKVRRLVLYASVWIRTTPSLVQAQGDKLGAYRTVKREDARARWLTGVPEDKKQSLIPAGWFEAWADATFASDPAAAFRRGPALPRGGAARLDRNPAGTRRSARRPGDSRRHPHPGGIHGRF